jgi:hypothetical protein
VCPAGSLPISAGEYLNYVRRAPGDERARLIGGLVGTIPVCIRQIKSTAISAANSRNLRCLHYGRVQIELIIAAQRCPFLLGYIQLDE